MRDLTFELNEANLPYWERPARLLAIIEAIKAQHEPNWIKSAGPLPMLCRELWQGAVAYFGMELVKGREYKLYPSKTEPFDYFAGQIDIEARHADYVAVQNKGIWNVNNKETNGFQPELLASFIAKQLQKYGEDPSITFMFFVNADALIDHKVVHTCLKERLNAQYPIWLFGQEEGSEDVGDNWFLRYVYPGFNERGMYRYKIEALPDVSADDTSDYLGHLRGFIDA